MSKVKTTRYDFIEGSARAYSEELQAKFLAGKGHHPKYVIDTLWEEVLGYTRRPKALFVAAGILGTWTPAYRALDLVQKSPRLGKRAKATAISGILKAAPPLGIFGISRLKIQSMLHSLKTSDEERSEAYSEWASNAIKALETLYDSECGSVVKIEALHKHEPYYSGVARFVLTDANRMPKEWTWDYIEALMAKCEKADSQRKGRDMLVSASSIIYNSFRRLRLVNVEGFVITRDEMIEIMKYVADEWWPDLDRRAIMRLTAFCILDPYEGYMPKVSTNGESRLPDVGGRYHETIVRRSYYDDIVPRIMNTIHKSDVPEEIFDLLGDGKAEEANEEITKWAKWRKKEARENNNEQK